MKLTNDGTALADGSLSAMFVWLGEILS